MGLTCSIPLNVRLPSLHGHILRCVLQHVFQFPSATMFPVPASEVCLSLEKNPTNPLKKKSLKGWNTYVVMLYVDFMTQEKCRKIKFFIEPEFSTK